MAAAPWGPVEALLDPRDRLFSAAVVVVPERGYGNTAVADLIEVAGVSRATFYKHFQDKQACVLAAIDALAAGTARVVAAELAGDGTWDRRLRSALDAFFGLIAAYPAAARLCLVDLWSVGPAGTERNERVIAQLEEPFRRVLSESPDHAGMPPQISRAIVGGVYKTIHGRVRRGEQADLAALAESLCDWGASYRPPPAPVRRPRSTVVREPAGPRFAAHGHAGRLFAACVSEMAERGYAAVTVDRLARRAQMSLHTVYSIVPGGKEEIMLATYDAGVAQGEAIAMPAYARRRNNWPLAVRAALEALLAYLAGDPAWARMSIVETLAGGERAMERSDRVIDSYAVLLQPGLERNPALAPITLEAIAGAVYTLVYEQVLRNPAGLPETLPLCTYVALAPFVGPDEALAVANDGGRHPRPSRGQAGASAGSESSAT